MLLLLIFPIPFGKMEVSIELNSIDYDASVSFLACLPAYLLTVALSLYSFMLFDACMCLFIHFDVSSYCIYCF